MYSKSDGSFRAEPVLIFPILIPLPQRSLPPVPSVVPGVPPSGAHRQVNLLNVGAVELQTPAGFSPAEPPLQSLCPPPPLTRWQQATIPETFRKMQLCASSTWLLREIHHRQLTPRNLA